MRLSRLVAPVAIALLIGGGAGIATAEPGPNGEEHKRKAPPFQALEAAAEAQDQTVEEWCAANGQHPGGAGGD